MQDTTDEKVLKVIVVDDSDFARRNVIQILENENIDVVGEASSTEEAFNLLSSTDVNLFIVDVVMPNASGIDLAKAILELGKNISIIMMSSLKMDHIVVESISNGAVDFLVKPFTSDELINSVRKVEQLIEQE